MKQKLIETFAARPRGIQTRIHERLDVPLQTVNNWANGKHWPPVEQWPALEVLLDLEPGTLAEAAGIKLPVDVPDIAELEAEVRRQGDEIRQIRAMLEPLLAPPSAEVPPAPARSKKSVRSTPVQKTPRS